MLICSPFGLIPSFSGGEDAIRETSLHFQDFAYNLQTINRTKNSTSDNNLTSINDKSSDLFKVALINVRSIRNKIILLCETLLDKKISICCITETWLTESDSTIYTELLHYGFKLLHCPRTTGKGGGVGLISKISMNISTIKSSSYKYFELFQANLRANTKNISFSIVYRTGQLTGLDRSNFLTEYESFLCSLDGSNVENFICGDFNIHVQDANNNLAKDFLELNESMGYSQRINVSTHRGGGTLDLIFTRDDFLPTSTIVYNQQNDVPISDHYMVVSSLTIECVSHRKRVNLCYRKVSDIDNEKFRSDLQNKVVPSSSQTHLELEVLDLFKAINSTLDKHAPAITKSKLLSSKSFTNEDIKHARRDCRKAERRFLKTGLQDDNTAFKEAKKKLIAVVKHSQNTFFSKKLKTAKNNSKAVYQIINHLLHKDQPRVLPEANDDLVLADSFAKFYQEKISNIVSKMEQTDSTRPKLLEIKSGNCNAIFSDFEPISKEFLTSLFKKTNNKFSSIDNIPSSLMNDINNVCGDKILSIINHSLSSGVFPEYLKISHATPIVKDHKGDVNCLSNYRLVSSLSFLSKFEEKCVLNQLQDHLLKNELNFSLQSAFKRNHSCETALLKIYNDLIKMSGSDQCILMLFLDFSSAFDTVCHRVLLKKLEHKFKIGGNVLSWFNSYLSNRKFRVKVGNSLSSYMNMDYGVPQGSVLGPALFSLYTQEIHEITDSHGVKIHMFADDIQLYLQCDRNNLNIAKMRDCLADIVKWSKRNYLKLNDKKSQFLVVSNKSVEKRIYNDFNYTMENVIKNLGFFVDQNLNFSAQINQVCRKGFNLLRNLWKISAKINDEQIKIRIVSSCILSHIDYCNSLYTRLPNNQIKKLQRLMNAAIRFIYNLRRSDDYSITAYMKRCHFLPVEFRVKYKICVLVYKYLYGLAPNIWKI